MNNPRITPPTPRPMDARPLYKRKRVWIGGFVLMVIGSAIGQSGAHDEAVKAAAEAKPTVTATATVTATPKPAVTVIKTAKPAPPATVTVTRTETADTGNSSLNTGSSNSGTCSIVSNAGNCYSAGEFCRNSDHGATTTDASGTSITCSLSGSRWRWTYS
ncbi:hypothetical protein AV521_15385 [Streptomyces sp. IMTB 2501]|uniref:hypothetical protein n=1 Tax=Streptomyces sp. IMTB 2501 TaxID=1776340 RepID=UPI00096DF7D4|nr:hypothetical protein [Streptomyces sp. IMTB 2501]OLZ70503.1 hypothetical protein AV521_15385 [Streptomyces sp. IMTB 2501]